MDTNQTYLQINNVVKQFGQFTALKDISLSINKGEFVCFLGPSGCGKTTLLRAIAGLDLPTYGQIEQADQDITFLPPEKRDFGIVFQSYALFPNLTVSDNIAIGLRNQGSSKSEAEETVNQWLDTIGLPTSGNKYPSQLSGGQQQRIALARALALSPGLLLLDEPLSALDAKVRTHLREEICLLQRKLGITTIMVTHDQEEALSMADRIVVMNHGVIEQVGTPQEIYEKPVTRFVAEFVGSMNFLEAKKVSDTQVVVHDHLIDVECAKFMQNKVVAEALGDKFELALRPESLFFSESNHNSLTVMIEMLEFQGAYMRVDCRIYGHPELPLIGVDVPVREARKLNLKVHEIRYLEFVTKHMHAYPLANKTVQEAA
ncbi:ABC transporter ATP-binding protein [Vibrio inusitatus NBRC 102082]|uniref:ABC transporter ATP-binding protein n=1 Tax=Vibrio inusitatus NBRC 102082 TaxID=1219070 RepID=A0A4Y3I100_9VIBR|nr:putative 2-aminoethylphosphonate ABC transporter ATP-binding protein [Vibrio inusitatus]GEA52941.1 ABC transporter ATP-binding protein [Vibrio inusitatus NBRC 102082]